MKDEFSSLFLQVVPAQPVKSCVDGALVYRPSWRLAVAQPGMGYDPSTWSADLLASLISGEFTLASAISPRQTRTENSLCRAAGKSIAQDVAEVTVCSGARPQHVVVIPRAKAPQR